MAYRLKLVEKLGSGIQRIRKIIKENRTEVEFKVSDGWFRIVFNRKSGISTTVGETVGETVVKILIAIKENPSITRNGLQKITGLSIRGIEWNLAKLKDRGIIKRIGPDKGGHWEIIEK